MSGLPPCPKCNSTSNIKVDGRVEDTIICSSCRLAYHRCGFTGGIVEKPCCSLLCIMLYEHYTKDGYPCGFCSKLCTVESLKYLKNQTYRSFWGRGSNDQMSPGAPFVDKKLACKQCYKEHAKHYLFVCLQ